MGMEPAQGESTGSLLTALRHVRYCSAFYAIESRFTVHDGPDPQSTWIVKLDKIKGTVNARNNAWKTGEWTVLLYSCQTNNNNNTTKHNGNNSATPTRFIWADGAMQVLVSSTGDCFGLEVNGGYGDETGRRLVLVPRAWDNKARRIGYIGGL